MLEPFDDPIEDALVGVTVDAAVDLAGSPTHFTAAIYGLIVLLGSLAALGPFAIDFYLPSFPTIAKDLHCDIAVVERTLAVYFIGLSIGQLFYGPAADRFGRKPPLYVGLTTFVLASIGCATAGSIGALIAWRFLQAVGGCAEMVIARAIIRDRFEARDAARVFSLLVLVMGLAPILGPLAGGWIVVHVGWRALFWGLAGFGAACLVVVATLLPETYPAERREKQQISDMFATVGRLLTDRTFMVHSVGAGLGSAALFAYIGGAAFAFIDLFHVPAQHFGIYFGMNAAGLIGCSQINGQLVKRYDMNLVLRLAMVLQTGAGLALLITTLTGFGGFVGFCVPLFLMVSSLGFMFPNTTALAMAPHGRVAGNASAVLGCLQFGLSGLGAFLVSTLQTTTIVPMTATIAGCATAALIVNCFAPSHGNADAH